MTPQDLTGSAIAQYRLGESAVELLDSSEHVTAKIHTADAKFFLKILSRDHTERGLISRLSLIDHLRRGGLSIPSLVQTESHQPFARITKGDDVRLATLSEWIDGETLAYRGNPQSIGRCGTLLAQFHLTSQSFKPPESCDLRDWSDLYLLANDEWLEDVLRHVDVEAQSVIESSAARTRTLGERRSITPSTFGVIHADFHGDNLIDDGETVWIVDLDDVGWGHYLFDVTWPAVLAAKHHPDVSDFLQLFLRGYESLRPLTSQDRELLPDFLLAAGIGALEMIHSAAIDMNGSTAQQWLTAIVKWLRQIQPH